MIEKSKKIEGKKSIHHLECFKHYFYYLFALWRTFSALFLYCASRSLLLKPRKRSEIKPGRQGQPAGRSKSTKKLTAQFVCTLAQVAKGGKKATQSDRLLLSYGRRELLSVLLPLPHLHLHRSFALPRLPFRQIGGWSGEPTTVSRPLARRCLCNRTRYTR